MKTKNRPLYLKLLVPMLVLILVEISLLAGSVFGGGLIRYMENNEIEVLHERVLNRQRYLQNEMLTRWSKVDSTVIKINQITEDLLQSGRISIDTLDDSSKDCFALLDVVSDPLLNMLRSNKVTGAFIAVNTDNLEELSEKGIYKNKPGIYVRDYDPKSSYSDRNTDLLLEYAPTEIVKNMNVSLDSGWKPQFAFEDMQQYGAYLYEPYQAALGMDERTELEASDMGYWSEPYQLFANDQEVISYSVPLILEDGTVYGVLGVELSLSYLEDMLPSEELKDKDAGSYLLGIEKESDTEITNVLISGADYSMVNGDKKVTEIYTEKNRQLIQNDMDEDIYCDVEYLTLYNTNTPFEQQRWVLTGIVRGKNLFRFSSTVEKTLIRGTLATLIAGIVGGILISLYISRPVTALTKSVRKMKPFSRIEFSRTGIREIDLMASELEHLNRETLYAAERFSYIVNAANLHLAVFEINSEEDSVFITGSFFDMLGLEQQSVTSLTEKEFRDILDSLDKYKQHSAGREDEILYKIPVKNTTVEVSKADTESGEQDTNTYIKVDDFSKTGSDISQESLKVTEDDNTETWKYIRITLKYNDVRCIGLVEDITDTAIEKENIEYERDHDLLTGLLNRRAFNRIMTEMFDHEKTVLKTAALVMIDLDELKHVNDTYGHDYGDKYIRTATECFGKYTPESTMICRRSGDEFNIFFYGYQNKDEIRECIRNLKEGIRKVSIHLPDHTELPIRMSAGIAWYPDDSRIYQELKTYSDFAMYQIKHTSKNQFGEFDKDAYLKDKYK